MVIMSACAGAEQMILGCGQEFGLPPFSSISVKAPGSLIGLSMAVLWLLPAAVAEAQETGQARIARVDLNGLNRENPSIVRDMIGVNAGDSFDRTALDRATSRLLQTGRFFSARYTTEETADGVVVTFELQERPMISAVRFEGNVKFRDKTLAGLATVKSGTYLDRFAIREGIGAIVAKYRDAGYGEVSVTVDEDLLSESGILVYRIEEGLQVKIRKIAFEGSTAFSDKELRDHVESKTAFWFIRTGAFDQERVEGDARLVQNFLRDQGFLDARVGYRRDFSEDREDLTLVFTIIEGTRYKIESIDFVGRTAFSEEELRQQIKSREGEFVQRKQVAEDLGAIRSLYGEYGYIESQSSLDTPFSSTPGLVRIIFIINEGGQFRVGKVTVRGNTRTRDKVVRRALDMFPPDDLWNVNAARNAEERLQGTQLFDSVRVFPIGDEPGVRDVVMDVQETANTTNVIFSAGVSSDIGVAGSVVLDLKNFDLFKPPRNFADLKSLRSFFGGGQRLRIELQPGTELTRFRIDFTEPYFNDRPTRLDTSAYLFVRSRENYDEGRTGGTVSIGKRFERGRFQGWSGELSLRLEAVKIDNLDIFAAREIRDVEGSSFLTALKGALVRDTTDSRFLPTRGERLRLSYEQTGALGGDYTFGKATIGYTRYETVKTDDLGRKSVFRFRTELGAIVGDAPMFERFYAGGIGSLRGFDFRGVGPREGIEQDNVGSDYMVLVGGEYTFPLAADNIRGLFFVDTGVLEGGFRGSVGTGIRILMNLPLLGPLPLEFNLGIPFSSQSGDERRAFSIIFGTAF